MKNQKENKKKDAASELDESVYGNQAHFAKKAEEAKKILLKVGLPQSFKIKVGKTG